MSENIGGGHEDPRAAPVEGGSALKAPGIEVLGVAPGKGIAVITPKLVFEIQDRHTAGVRPAQRNRKVRR